MKRRKKGRSSAYTAKNKWANYCLGLITLGKTFSRPHIAIHLLSAELAQRVATTMYPVTTFSPVSVYKLKVKSTAPPKAEKIRGDFMINLHNFEGHCVLFSDKIQYSFK